VVRLRRIYFILMPPSKQLQSD